MPNTTNYSFPTPADTDLVKNGADAIRDLGDAVDTAMNTALGTKKAGMVLLNTTSFSAVASTSFAANTFTSTYTNYYLIVQLSSASANTSLRFRMRAAGSDDTGGNYAVAGLSTRSDSATIGSSRDAIGLTSWYAGDYNSARPSTWFMDVTNPNVATQTLTNVRTITNDTSNTLFNYYHGGLHSQATAYDSMTIFPSTGTITGTYYIYGVNK
jgi:hypothetical protein